MQTFDERMTRSAQDVAAGAGSLPESSLTGSSKTAWIRSAWRWFWSPSAKYSFGFIAVVAFVVGIVFWGGFNTVMDATNTEAFCISCHVMENNVYREYQQTAHYTNRSGVRATCPDCHVPKDWTHKMVAKFWASNDVLQTVLGSIDTREKFVDKRLTLAKRTWQTMKTTDSRECRSCHELQSMDFLAQEKRSADKHQLAIKDGSTCIDCHQGLSHKLPAGAKEAYSELQAATARK